MIDTGQISTAIQFGDQRAAQLQRALSAHMGETADLSQRDAQDAANVLCNPTDLELAITTLQQGCARVKDAVTVIEAHFEHRLTVEQERRFARELWQMASRTGDVVGRLDDEGGYAIAMPWTDEAQAMRLANVVLDMATYAAPDVGCAIGYQTLRNHLPRPTVSIAPTSGRSIAHPPAAAPSRLAEAVTAVGSSLRKSRSR